MLKRVGLAKGSALPKGACDQSNQPLNATPPLSGLTYWAPLCIVISTFCDENATVCSAEGELRWARFDGVLLRALKRQSM